MAAAERSGLYYTCINSYLTPDEVAYIVDNCEARVFFTSAAKSTSPSRPPRHDAQGRGVPAASTPTRRSARSSPTTTPSPPSRRRPSPTSSSARRCSTRSGTTGRPKGILRPLPDAHPGDALPLMDFIMQMFRFREGMMYLSPAPIYHSAPQASVSAALRLGATSVIMERFDPEQYLDLVERHRITHSQVVPTMFSRMLKLPDGRARRATTCRRSRRSSTPRRPCPVPVKQDDDRVVRPEDHRVLRRHRGQRLHVLRLRGVAGPPGHRRPPIARRRC